MKTDTFDFLIPPRRIDPLSGTFGGEVKTVRVSGIAAEGYRLEARPERVEIQASTEAGEFYARQTLRELESMGRPACVIEDTPDFKRRGVFLDCSRGKVPKVSTLKALFERLARWKINEVQLYITNVFTWEKHPLIGRGFSSFTPGQLQDLQAHAKRFHIRLIPALAGFSHMEQVLMLPAYRELGELPYGLGWPGGTTLCPGDPRSIRLLEDLFSEILPLFDADEFNAGCDEPWELGQGRSVKEVGRRGKGRVYLDFLLKMDRICDRLGKRMNIWGDILLSHPELLKELPADVTILNWDYNPDGRFIPMTGRVVEAGRPVVVCPGTHGWATHGSKIRKSMANIARFAAEARAAGAEGLLNTDWGDYGHRNFLGVSLHGYAYGAAKAWNGNGVSDATFTETFARSVFGDGEGRLAAGIRELGNRGEDAFQLYHSLVEPLRPPAARFISEFRHTSITSHYPARFPECIPSAPAEVPKIKWPKVSKNLPEFEILALREYETAGRMDSLATARAHLGRKLRAGERIRSAEFTRWADGMENLIPDFEALWRKRNRLSRLQDNLTLMQKSLQEGRENCR